MNTVSLVLFVVLLVSGAGAVLNDVLLQLVEASIHGALDKRSNSISREGSVPEGVIPSSQTASEDSKKLQIIGEILEEATLSLKRQHGISSFTEANRVLDILNSNGNLIETGSSTCAGPPKNCQDPVHDSIRSITGYCNNRQNPTQANALTPIRRLLGSASYSDGVQEMRSKSVTGGPLPSARLISNKLHGSSSVFESSTINHLHMQIGQFIAHDVIFMPSSVAKDGGALNCSSCSSHSSVSPNCAPIPVPSDDKYFRPVSKSETRCLRFTRALNGQNSMGARTQIDQNTHYLDLSTVYGSSDCEAKSVRSFSSGLLKTYTGMGYVLPPQNPSDANCQSKSPYYCFTAGDFRNCLHPGLLPLHSVFIKQHNRLAVKVKSLKPMWTDEQIYQLVRKILVGQWQHVVYTEYLPKLLSDKLLTDFNLKPGRGSYSPSTNAALTAEFAAAAFRFGHSQSREHFAKKNVSRVTIDKYNLGSNIFYSDQVYQKSQGGWESILLGMIGTASMLVDRYFSFPIRNQLFEIRGRPGSGVDLVSVNIMRGRDVGLHPYVKYRTLVGLPRVVTWNDLSSTFSSNNLAALRKVYADPADVDLFTGIVMETPLAGSQLGPTGAWIIAEQFRALKAGDRFFYEHKVPGTVGFTSEQLSAIRRVKLAKIFCENTQTMSSVNSEIFALNSKLVPCSTLPDIDLKLFL